MTNYWAHSAREGIPAQSYSEHIENVRRDAVKNAERAGGYSPKYGKVLTEASGLAAEYHDLGKLDPGNQAVLACEGGKGRLPLNHVDAGTAYLLQAKSFFAALMVYAHHRGLPSIPTERTKEKNVFRDVELRDTTEARLGEYLKVHRSLISNHPSIRVETQQVSLQPVLARMALSWLVDADHSDNAKNYGQGVYASTVDLCETAEKRLAVLDRYVKDLTLGKSAVRTNLRSAVYVACRDADTKPSMLACDSGVGTGKTTAIMAHLLRAVASKGLRRVIVVLPFTNIIDQSVNVYRKALLFPSENPADVVAAHHHRVEFEDWRSRQFSVLWQSPVIVTTAVQFFETLANNQTASLRKLHQIAGSAIFIDEAHAALPSHLWPPAWRWLKELSEDWGCHFVFGSGSLTRFWELNDFVEPPVKLPELVPEDVRTRARGAELGRITYRTREDPLGLAGLIQWVSGKPGPRLLILNTVQSAAAIARELDRKCGRATVEHLSTALAPYDRRVILHQVKNRLEDPSDNDWTLVATSCVEAGVDLSFRTCFRERCSLVSLIQTGGRGNRSGEYDDTVVWDFSLLYDEILREHPAFGTSARILKELFVTCEVSPEQCKEALKREIRQDGLKKILEDISIAEKNRDFPAVEEAFKVIDSNTITAVVDEGLQLRLESGEKVLVEELQNFSVQIWSYRKEEWALRDCSRFPGVMFWTLAYDEFLGYMAGVLEALDFKTGKSITL
jgi:CRISPR-associated endonuclease/helicase Cas3